MKTLIVGCGYVGVALGAELARCGHGVFGLRRTPAAAPELVEAGIQPVYGDLTSPADLDRLPGPFDWVVNCVSSSHGGAADYRHVYLEGMRTLVDWARRHPPQKLVYTSSTSVYGQEDGSWVDETSPTEPEAETSQVLLAAEKVALDAARAEGPPVVVLRVGGIYGPGRGYLFRQYLSGQGLPAGQEQRISNMIHRTDVAGCICAALERGRAGEIYNAVDDEPVTYLDFLLWVAQTLQRPTVPPVVDAASSPRKRGASNKRVSNRKLKAELGYRFQFPTFREGYAAEIERVKGGG